MRAARRRQAGAGPGPGRLRRWYFHTPDGLTDEIERAGLPAWRSTGSRARAGRCARSGQNRSGASRSCSQHAQSRHSPRLSASAITSSLPRPSRSRAQLKTPARWQMRMFPCGGSVASVRNVLRPAARALVSGGVRGEVGASGHGAGNDPWSGFEAVYAARPARAARRRRCARGAAPDRGPASYARWRALAPTPRCGTIRTTYLTRS